MKVCVHHPVAGELIISLGDGRQTFRWLAKAVESRVSVFKLARTATAEHGSDLNLVTAFKNRTGELLNPFDMIYEHGEKDADQIDIWAESTAELVIDNNGDPEYPEWLSAAFVISDEGRKWQNTITHFRENNSDTGKGANAVLVGDVSDGQGAVAAFNIDVSNLNFDMIDTPKNIIMKNLIEGLRGSYGSFCGLFGHFCGAAEVGKEYGLTVVEFGRFLHYTKTLNVRLFQDKVDAIFHKVVGKDRAALLMSRSELIQALLLLYKDEMGSVASNDNVMEEWLSATAERVQDIWIDIHKMSVRYRDDVKLQHTISKYQHLLKHIFTRGGITHDESAPQALDMTPQTFSDICSGSGVAEKPEDDEEVRLKVVRDAQLQQEEGWELETLVFAEFLEAMLRFASSAITVDLPLAEKIKLTFEAIAELKIYK
jgi:hypothetical protein